MFLPSFSSLDHAVSDKIFRTMAAMFMNESRQMSNLYRGHLIAASHQHDIRPGKLIPGDWLFLQFLVTMTQTHRVNTFKFEPLKLYCMTKQV